jgi:hypothetical protein
MVPQNTTPGPATIMLWYGDEYSSWAATPYTVIQVK